MNNNNQTKKDAYKRVITSRYGSLDNPSTEYLLTLQKELTEWLEAVEIKIKRGNA